LGCISAFNVHKPALKNGDFGVQPVQFVLRRFTNVVQPMQIGGDIKQAFVDRSDLPLHLMFRLHDDCVCLICGSFGALGAPRLPERFRLKTCYLLGKFI
jgi:hypothetical protein